MIWRRRRPTASPADPSGSPPQTHARTTEPQEIGVLFDIDELGGGMYGWKAYRILFASLDPQRLRGCSLHDGDVNATIAGLAQLYCIVVRSSDPRAIHHVRQAMSSRADAGLLPADLRLVDGEITRVEPLVPAGAVDRAGRLVVRPDDMLAGMATERPGQDGWTVVTGEPPFGAESAAWRGTTVPPGDGTDVGRTYFQRLAQLRGPEQAPRAMLSLATLMDRQGDASQAREWYRRAAESGDVEVMPSAMFMLGSLLAEHGDPAGARDWYRRAIDSGHAVEAPKAMVNLASLLYRDGDIEAARPIYQRAAETGHAESALTAMYNLGILLARQGNTAGARLYLERAADIGHGDLAARARRDLQVLRENGG